MTIEIPSWLIATLFYLCTGLLAGCVIALAVLLMISAVMRALKSRGSFWLCSTWLFCRQYRDDAEAYTFDILRTVASKISRENPDQYRWIRRAFGYQDADEQVDKIVSALLKPEHGIVITYPGATLKRDQSILRQVITAALNEGD